MPIANFAFPKSLPRGRIRLKDPSPGDYEGDVCLGWTEPGKDFGARLIGYYDELDSLEDEI